MQAPRPRLRLPESQITRLGVYAICVFRDLPGASYGASLVPTTKWFSAVDYFACHPSPHLPRSTRGTWQCLETFWIVTAQGS